MEDNLTDNFTSLRVLSVVFLLILPFYHCNSWSTHFKAAGRTSSLRRGGRMSRMRRSFECMGLSVYGVSQDKKLKQRKNCSFCLFPYEALPFCTFRGEGQNGRASLKKVKSCTRGQVEWDRITELLCATQFPSGETGMRARL